jgi:chorismate mutase-like protein
MPNEPPPDEPSLALMRAAIDSIDHAILTLVERRLSLVADIFAKKRRAGLPLLDPGREQELLAERRAFAAAIGPDHGLTEAIVRLLLEASHDRAAEGGGGRRSR